MYCTPCFFNMHDHTRPDLTMYVWEGGKGYFGPQYLGEFDVDDKL